MGCVLVAGYTRGNAIGVGDVVGKLDLETEIVETVGMLFGHTGELEVVSGDETSDRQRADGFEEETGAVEFVEGVGALEDFIEDDEGTGIALDSIQQLLQAQQFGVEIRDAVSEVVGGAHGSEQGEG